VHSLIKNNGGLVVDQTVVDSYSKNNRELVVEGRNKSREMEGTEVPYATSSMGLGAGRAGAG